ncbi:MAG TPA: tetratricopeptide repeat protein [Anaeromyxobacter sp.]|jgi:tetratricopeptide (TPR) repeat protein|nr:tetratricopeptide repeat protein [Anaeromyxobacter sp.]
MRLAVSLRRPATLAALTVAVAAAAPFLGTVRHGFALDDGSEIVRNDDVRALRNVAALFARGAWAGAGEDNPIYRPLNSATYAVNYAIGGLDPAGYHAVNVALHVLVSLLLLAVGRRLGLGWPAATLAAALFAVHPLHVEVVANVAGRKDALAAAFVLAALLAHRVALREGGSRLWLPVACVAAALFSKESGVAAIGFVAAWDLLLAPEEVRARLGRAAGLYATYGVVLIAYLLARRAAVGSFGVPLTHIPFGENPLAHVDPFTRALNAVAVLGRGLLLTVLPARLSADYSWDAIPVLRSPLAPAFLLSLAALVALVAAAWRARRTRPVFLFCAAWYGIAIFPASNLVLPVGTIFGERLLYLPSAAVFLAVAALVEPLVAAPRAAAAVRALCAAAVVVLGVRAGAYAQAWSNEVSLFEAAVRAQPGSAKAHDLLGAAYMEEGRVDEGIGELSEAVRRLSTLPEPPVGQMVKLGVALERADRLADAERVYRDILGARPDEPDALWRLGVVRWREGRRDEAVALWERTLTVAPDHARAMNDLGIAMAARGDLAGAEALWTRATQLDPRSPGAWLSLGNLYERRGDHARAVAAWREFLERARYGAYVAQREAIAARLEAEARGGGQ